jgi:hypothetical protein
VENKVVTRAFKHVHDDIRRLQIDVDKLKNRRLNDLLDVADTEHPQNGQMLAYVEGDNCEGYWLPVDAPSEG